MFVKKTNNNFFEVIISIKVDWSWFTLYKLRLLAMERRVSPAVDSLGVNSKEITILS